MSLFDGLTEGAARKPDVVIGGNGPLLDIQASSVRDFSGKINQGSSFFDGVAPYGGLSVSDDVNYRHRPTKVQKVVPEIMLPAVKGNPTPLIKLSHAVASGDLAFTIHLKHSSKSTVITNFSFFDKINLGAAVDCLVSLPCVNYILAGFCRYSLTGDKNADDKISEWVRFLGAILGDFQEAEARMTKKLDMREDIERITKLVVLLVKEYIKPFGFCIGSDWQGGQTQGSHEPNIGPVSYVTVVQIEGLAENIVNLWSKAGNQVNCGDDLFLGLVPHLLSQSVQCKLNGNCFPMQFSNIYQPMRSSETYILNHWASNVLRQTFNGDRESEAYNLIFELLPLSTSTLRKGAFSSWHICRSQLMAKSNVSAMKCYRDDSVMQKTGALLEVTIAPVFENADLNPLQTEMFSNLAELIDTLTPKPAEPEQETRTAEEGVEEDSVGGTFTASSINDTLKFKSIIRGKPSRKKQKFSAESVFHEDIMEDDTIRL